MLPLVAWKVKICTWWTLHLPYLAAYEDIQGMHELKLELFSLQVEFGGNSKGTRTCRDRT